MEIFKTIGIAIAGIFGYEVLKEVSKQDNEIGDIASVPVDIVDEGISIVEDFFDI